MEVDVKTWRLQKYFYYELPCADVPNASKSPLSIPSLNTTSYGCKKIASLIRLYVSAFVLYVPSKSYIFHPHRYKHPL